MKKQSSKRHPSLDCNAREKHFFLIFRFSRYASHFYRTAGAKRENVKLLPRDKPRKSYEYIWKCQIFWVETHKGFIVRNGFVDMWNEMSEKNCVVYGLNLMFVQQIELHLLDVCFRAVNRELYNRIMDAARDKKKTRGKNFIGKISIYFEIVFIFTVECRTRVWNKKKICLKSSQSMNIKMSVRGLVNRHYEVTYLF